MKKHLLEGAKKGAFDVAEADNRFAAWKASKESSVIKTKEQLVADKKADAKTRLAAEVEVNKMKSAEVAKKKADAIAAAAPVITKVEPVEETPEVVAEEAPEVVVEVPEIVAEEAAPEAKEVAE
jgi:small subunit ribosomal protein S16